LCEALDAWSDLTPEAQCRLVLLLHGLCFFELVVALVPPVATGDVASLSPECVELAYWRESALYMLRMPRRFADYRAADLSGFEAIATDAPHSVHAAFNASVKVFVHLAKTGADSDELDRRSGLMGRRLAEVGARLDPFTAALLASRFHRAFAYLPMRRGDRAEVARHMERAEQVARALQPATAAQQLLFTENLHPVLESRSKEALWLDDRDLALARAREVTELDRYDPKSWLELGQLLMAAENWRDAADAFVAAAMLGPPVGAISRQMAGLCFRRLGQDILASFFFQSALEIDSLGLSPRVEINALPPLPFLDSLKEWSSRRFEPRTDGTDAR
jgi:tetratricopeptide (TPR) repeat protein